MSDNEDVGLEIHQQVKAFKSKINRDIMRVYNDVISCQCAHTSRLASAAYMENNDTTSNLTSAEKLLCFIVVLVAALAAYVGYAVKLPGYDCGCGGAEYF